jgi:hypothetical protein
MRVGRLATAIGVVASVLFLTGSAAASQVVINFDSLSDGTALVNRLNPPAGPQFKSGSELIKDGVGFPSNCGVPHVDGSDSAYSGSKSAILDGCAGGDIGHYTAGYFALGYTTDDVGFELGSTVSRQNCPNFICAEIWTTFYDANLNVLLRQQTLLSPFDAYKGVAYQSASDNIAFVSVEAGHYDPNNPADSLSGVTLGAGGQYLLLDDLTYNPPSSPPASSFIIGATPPKERLAVGASVGVKLSITWTNNPDPSSTPVSLELAPPSGITGSFTPTTTSSGTSTLNLSVEKWSPTGSTSVAATGYVDKGQPFEKHSSVVIPVDVVPAFAVSPVGDKSIAACTPELVGVHVASDATFSDPVDTNVYTPYFAKVLGVSPGSVVNANHAEATLDPHNGADSMTLTVRADAGTPTSAPAKVYVEAVSSGYAEQDNAISDGHISVVPGDLTNIFFEGKQYGPGVGHFIPGGFRRPATRLDLFGRGFCQGSQVQFGSVTTTPDSIAADGRKLTVQIPPEAIDGPIKVIPPTDTAVIDPNKNLQIENLRAHWSLPFTNNDATLKFHDYSYKQFVQVYGDDLFLKIDVCAGLTLGLAHCPVSTGIPDPVQWIVFVSLKGRGHTGLCYGIARTEGLFANGGESWSGYTPLNSKWPNDLDMSTDILERINLNYIYQWDTNLLAAKAGLKGLGGPTVQAAAIRQIIVDAFANGDAPIVDLAKSAFDGHALLAYDLVDGPNGTYKIFVVDSNYPFNANEKTNGPDHVYRQDKSVITVDPNANQWEYQFLTDDDTKKPWSGQLDGKSLWAQPPGLTYRTKPTMPGVSALPYLVLLASTGSDLSQVTDAKGRQLIAADGTSKIPEAAAIPPTDAASGPNPTAMLPLSGDYTAVASRPAGKPGALTAAAKGFAATADLGDVAGHAPAVGSATVEDRLEVAGKTHEATVTPGAAGNESLTLAAHVKGGETHVVALDGRGSPRGSDSIRIGKNGIVELAHTGPAATRTLTLGWTGRAALPATGRLAGLRLASGEHLTLHVADWRHLRGVTAVRRGRRTTLHLRPVRAKLLGALKVSASVSGRKLKVTARVTGRGHALAGGVAFFVARGKAIVARALVPLSGDQLAQRRSTVSWDVPKELQRGRYRVVAVATASTVARGGVTTSDKRVARIRARIR